MSQLINPATNKPFKQVQPNRQIIRLREQILRTLRSKYDAAQTTSQNELHWAQADALSPNAANSLSVRKKLRDRSRYETANNGYLQGITLSLALDMVGSGPTLQVTDPRLSEEQRSIIEKKWSLRTKQIKLRRKLRRLRLAKCRDGEGFSFSVNDFKLRDQVKVNQRVYECDQVSHYNFDFSIPNNEIDGLRFNLLTGEPEAYHLLNDHPGETFMTSMRPLSGRWINADNVIHWFFDERGALRGIPETIPTLPLWALIRRYTLAVIQNAEIAADFTVLLESMQPAATTPFSLGSDNEPTQDDPDDWFSSFPLDRGLMTVLPGMYQMKQLDPKQPVNMYDSFVNALIQEAARPLLVPRNLAIGNSGDYNMSAGTIDRQMYRSAISNERLDCEEEVLDKDLDQWWEEAIRIPNYFEDEITPRPTESIRATIAEFPSLRESPPEHTYRWDEVPEHTDPVKVAQAIDILHKGKHISDKDIQETRFNRSTDEHYENLREQEEARKEFEPDPMEDPNFNNLQED